MADHYGQSPGRSAPEPALAIVLSRLKLRFESVRRACLAAVEEGAAPGFVLGVWSDGQVLFEEAFGSRQLVPRTLPVRPDTVYDVASVTKAVVTSVLCMQEAASGRLHLDAPVVDGLPELAGEGREAITWRHLLAHASGLPAHRPFWRRVAGAPSGRLAIAQLAAREPLTHPPGSRAVYSDLGFILLGWWLERSTGRRLDQLFAARIAAPLGLASARFVSLAEPEIARRAAGHAIGRRDAGLRRAAPAAAGRGRRPERRRHGGDRRARRACSATRPTCSPSRAP